MRIAGFILVIDSYLVRLGLVAILNRIHGIRVIKEFGSGDSFLAYLKSHLVEYLIISQAEFDRSIDFFISKPDLLEKTILIRDGQGDGHMQELAQHDAHTIIYLQEDKESIIRKIQNLLNPGLNTDSDSNNTKLSPRETTIVRMVSMGLTNRQIAEKLFLSAHTVMTHRKNISSKLGIKSVSGLTVYAIVNNIITIEEVSSLPPK
jgi:DNA-binding NarL/FixJ family response regulator